MVMEAQWAQRINRRSAGNSIQAAAHERDIEGREMGKRLCGTASERRRSCTIEGVRDSKNNGIIQQQRTSVSSSLVPREHKRPCDKGVRLMAVTVGRCASVRKRGAQKRLFQRTERTLLSDVALNFGEDRSA